MAVGRQGAAPAFLWPQPLGYDGRMARRALALLITAALASPGQLALAQTSPATPLQSVDPPAPAGPEPATVLPPPRVRALPATPRPRPLPVPSPPTSIDDLLDQAAAVEPQGMAPIPDPEVGPGSDQLDMRIRGASAMAQSLQGPMDGAWSLRDDQGAPLYTFQLADPANNPGGVVEGAWRDLRDGQGGAGLISSIERSPGRLHASFTPGGAAASVDLVQGADGAWTGQLAQDGAVRQVRMIRTEPMLEAEPLRVSTGDVVSPYRTPASNRVAPARAKKATKSKAPRKASARKRAPKKASASRKRKK